MITKLNNFTLKSFVGYTNPNDLLFLAKNILFGYNGKGKSAVAIGIKDEFLKDQTKKPENLRIFDRDYISNSLLLEDSDGKIKGVEASFGKGGVDIENKIKELEKLIIKEDEIGKLDTGIAKLRKEIRTEIDKIHYRIKCEYIKSALKVGLILLLDEYGYPPVERDEVYHDNFEQAESFKKNKIMG